MEDIPQKANNLVESLEKDSRSYIIECAVFIEERASETIGKLLNIDWKKSETLGYGSSSISFDNKIKLIQDIKGVDKSIRVKFQCFMAIRNKFAHISEVNSFKNYLIVIKSSKERKNELKKWFPNLKWETDDIEGVFKFAYLCLTLELNRELFKVELMHEVQKGTEKGMKVVYQKFMNETKSILQELNSGNEIFEKIMENVKNKID